MHRELDFIIGMRLDQHQKRVLDKLSLDASLTKVTEAVEAGFHTDLHVTLEKALDRTVDLLVGQRT